MGMETIGVFLVLALTIVMPCFAVLMATMTWAANRIMSTIWSRFEGQVLSWPEFSDAGQAPPAMSTETKASYCQSRINRYKAAADTEDGQPLKCCFCLCDVRRGDEFRELRCSHVFHMECLDQWVDHGRSECPLCRTPLAVSPASSAQFNSGPECMVGIHSVGRWPP